MMVWLSITNCSGRGVTLTPHPLLVPRSKIEYSHTSISIKALVAYERVKPNLT
jgi:hypothetical protein